MKEIKLKFLDKGSYFEIGDITSEKVKSIGRFVKLTTDSLENILKLTKKDTEKDIVKKYYNEYVREIKNHNSIVRNFKATFKNTMNPEDVIEIVNKTDKSLTHQGFYPIHDIVCNNLFFS